MGVSVGESADLPESVVIELRRTAAELLGNVSSYADDMLAYIVERIPEADADDELRGLTLGSCSSNLEAALSMVRHGIDVSAATAPVTALEHARAMAARGYSVDVMLRFYRIGHAYFSERILTGIADVVTDPALALAVVADLQRYAFAYVDRISSEVAAEYVAELDRMQTRVRAARTDAVRGLIAGDQIDLGRAERALSHRLTGWQTAFVCWTDRDDADLARVGAAVGAHLGSPHPLLVPDGAQALWGWVSTSRAPGVAPADLAPLADQIPTMVRISIGTPAQGAAGFRDSHAQAQRGRRIVELSGRGAPVTSYTELALVDTMSGDLDLARAFVATELGGLAVDGAPRGGGTTDAAGSARRTGRAGRRSRGAGGAPQHRAAAPAPGGGASRATRPRTGSPSCMPRCGWSRCSARWCSPEADPDGCAARTSAWARHPW